MLVAADGSGDFTRIQEALDQIPSDNTDPVVIQIKNGTYKEKLHIVKPWVSLIGEDQEKTVITFDDYALMQFPDGERYETFNSYTVFIGADHVHAENLTFENTAGIGDLVGQAVAAYVDGDCTSFRNCRFLAHQDTLFTGPLPLAPIQRATFGGPREGHPRRPTRQYYEGCFIRGDIDFIFGSATAVFNRCEIFSNRQENKAVQGWVTAPSTPEGQPYGYVFLDCDLTGEASPRSVYLGRPWRNHAKSAFIGCRLGAHIHPEGWDNWDKPESETTTAFCEFGNSGPGSSADQRVRWSKQLEASDAARFTLSNILAGEDGWNPSNTR
ncbi:pectinesterase family protein [Paenibacillus cremeus]|uniref:Pectinesterase n=1 Tax=Paenibacillus cremeus TaxID=2163881 RepID=A0A559KGI4_9BACL|nr:pectinesterase family protein [Paenibacillus cremeus]TVY11241.1 pectin methylesterase [Paenibacillus cremeus]